MSCSDMNQLFQNLSIDQFIDEDERRHKLQMKEDEQSVYDQCRFCGDEEESVEHIISKCQILAPSEYRSRHDKVARAIHWCLCEVHRVSNTSKDWRSHKVKDITETANVKIFWDYRMILLKQIVHHDRPDIIVVDKRNHKVFIVEVAVSRDSHVVYKERFKKDKYEELARVMELSWIMGVTVLPVIVGAFGNMRESTRKSLEQLQILVDPLFFQKIVFSETIVILRKALCL